MLQLQVSAGEDKEIEIAKQLEREATARPKSGGRKATHEKFPQIIKLARDFVALHSCKLGARSSTQRERDHSSTG